VVARADTGDDGLLLLLLVAVAVVSDENHDGHRGVRMAPRAVVLCRSARAVVG
jgi:hypothetical protein